MSSLGMRRWFRAIAFVSGLLPTLSCNPTDHATRGLQAADKVVARIGSHTITAGDLTAIRGERNDPRRQLDAVIARRLAAQEARRKGLAKTDEMQQRLTAIQRQAAAQEEAVLRDALFAKLKSDLKLSDQDLRDFYEKTKIRFAIRELHLRRAAFASKADAEAAFAKLTAQGRLDPKSSEEIGPAPIEKLPPTVLPEALQLRQPGDRVLIQRGSDAAIVELLEILPAEPRPFEEVRDKVEESLRTIRAQEAFNMEMERLRAEAKVEVDQAALQSLASQPSVPPAQRP